MTKACSIPIAALSVLASCQMWPHTLPVQPDDSAEGIEKLLDEVSNGDWQIKDSLPELRYVKKYREYPCDTITTTYLLSAEGHLFQILVIYVSFAPPGAEFMLIYLRDPQGKIVDWRSQWLYGRHNRLKTKTLDINQDGVADFCFVRESFDDSQQLLSSFCVRKDKFDPVIAEDKCPICVRFEETTVDEGIVIQPDHKDTRCLHVGKIYELPVRIFNRSDKPLELWYRYAELSIGRFNGFASLGKCQSETLSPGCATEAVITFMFAGCPDQTVGFKFTPR